MFLNNGQNEWYQRGIPDFGDTITDTIDKIKQWISALNIIETYTMGTSMGGYAAIQYGIALNAKILAFAPDVILCDEHTKSKKFLLKGITPVCSDLRTIIDNTKHTIDIMVGESDIEDLYSVSLLRKYKQVRITSLRDVDHFVPSSLTKKSYFIRMVNNFIDNKPLPELPMIGEALTVEGFIEMVVQALKFYNKNNWVEAQKHAQEALIKAPLSEAALLLLGHSYFKQGNFLDAMESFSLAANMSPSNPNCLFMLAETFRKLENTKQAFYLLNILTDKFPNFAKAYYSQGIISLQNNKKSKAKELISIASRLEPKNKTF